VVFRNIYIVGALGNTVNGKSAFEAASLIQGPKGTKVSLKVGFDSHITVFVSVESFLPHKSLCL
jgi:hypothetical protein